MTRIRLFTLACFAIAMLLYPVAWMPGAIGFAVLGLIFEVVGWADLFLGERKDEG